MPTAVLDERGRVVLPREIVDELGVGRGDMVVFERSGGNYVVKGTSGGKRRLEEVMDWNPPRDGKPENVTPREMKEVWKG